MVTTTPVGCWLLCAGWRLLPQQVCRGVGGGLGVLAGAGAKGPCCLLHLSSTYTRGVSCRRTRPDYCSQLVTVHCVEMLHSACPGALLGARGFHKEPGVVPPLHKQARAVGVVVVAEGLW